MKKIIYTDTPDLGSCSKTESSTKIPFTDDTTFVTVSTVGSGFPPILYLRKTDRNGNYVWVKAFDVNQAGGNGLRKSNTYRTCNVRGTDYTIYDTKFWLYPYAFFGYPDNISDYSPKTYHFWLLCPDDALTGAYEHWGEPDYSYEFDVLISNNYARSELVSVIKPASHQAPYQPIQLGATVKNIGTDDGTIIVELWKWPKSSNPELIGKKETNILSQNQQDTVLFDTYVIGCTGIQEEFGIRHYGNGEDIPAFWSID